MKDILKKLSEIAGTEKELTVEKKMLTEDSVSPPAKTEKKSSSLKDVFEAMATKQPIPVVGKEGGTQSTGAGFINVTDTSPAATALAQAVGKLAQDKKLQIVVPTATQQSGTAAGKPAAGATGQAPAGAQAVSEKWGDIVSFEQIVDKYPNEIEHFKETGEITDDIYQDLYALWQEDMPYGTLKARTGDPYQWIGDKLERELDKGSKKLDEKWDTETKVAPSEKGKYEGKTKAELLKQYNALKAKGPHKKGSSEFGKMRELAFAIRAKGGWGKVKEEKVDEVITKKTPAGEIISDFEKSKNPKFKGKSKEKRKEMALGAYYGMHPEKSKKEESVEEAKKAKEPFAVGMAAAMKKTGDEPPLKKSTVKKAHEIGKSIAKKQKVKEAERPSDQVDMGAGLGAGRSPTTLEGKTTMKKVMKKNIKEGAEHRISAARAEGRSHGLRGHSHCGKNYEDLEERKSYCEGYKDGLDECYGMGVYEAAPAMPAATVGGMADEEMMDDVMMDDEMDEGNAFTAALAKTPHGGKFKVAGKTFTDTSDYDSKLDEYTFESLDKQLNALLTESKTESKKETKKPLTEGVSVSMSTGTPGGSDTVNINATDEDAAKVLQLIKQAGLGGFGAEPEASDYGSPSEPGKHGGIAVVDDHDGMMGMMKKLAGIQAQGGNEDYADEEGSEGGCGCEDAMEEGHTCGEGKEMVDEVETTDQREFQVAEDQTEEEETTADEDAEAAEDATKPASGGATNESAEEEEDVTESQEDLTEWANNAGKKGTDASFEQDIEFMTKVISGGLNKPKSTGQTTIPVIANQTERTVDKQGSVSASVDDFKKLAGIK